MTTTQDKYQRLYNALIQAPEYLGLPHNDRTACKKFMPLAARLGTNNPPDPTEIEVAYASALEEARGLVAAGKLTTKLPESGEAAASGGVDSEPPPAEDDEAAGLAQRIGVR